MSAFGKRVRGHKSRICCSAHSQKATVENWLISNYPITRIVRARANSRICNKYVYMCARGILRSTSYTSLYGAPVLF